MGGRQWAKGSPALPALLGALVALALPACGEEEEPEPSVTRGPSPPSGDVISTPATIRPEEGYATLAGTTARSGGSGEALIVGLVLAKGAADAADYRLTIDGEPVDQSETRAFSNGEEAIGGSVVTVYCACELQVGESDVALEGSASTETRVGGRALVVYTPAALEGIPSGEILSSAAIEDQTVNIDSAGASMISTVAGDLSQEAEKLIVIAAYRSPAESSASPDVIRVEGLLDGEAMDEIGSATIPGGKIAVFFSPSGADAGTELELRGFVTAGNAPVTLTTVAACPCDLEQ